MSTGNWFWLILVVSVLFGAGGWFAPEGWRYRVWGGGLLVLLILVALLGYRVFGSPVQ